MKGSRFLVTALLVLSFAACKKDKAKDTEVGSGSAVASGSPVAGSGSDVAGSGSAVAGSGSDAGSGSANAGDVLMSKKGGNCPTLVATSTTKVTVDEKKGTVTVGIAATDANAVASIQARTKAWKDRKDDGGGSAHDSKGSKGGDSGICAVAAPALEVAEAKDTKDGVTITLKLDADGAKMDDAAKKATFAEVQARADKGAEWMKANLKEAPGGQGGTGDGGGNHGRDHSGKGDATGKQGGGTGGGAGTGGGGGAGTGGGSGKGSAAKTCPKGGVVWAGGEPPKGCSVAHDGCCYADGDDACAAIGCPKDKCVIAESFPGQPQCKK
jgi:hypothetical protein